MSEDQTDFHELLIDVKIADLTDKIERLEAVADRFQNILEGFTLLFKEARVQGLEALFNEMLKSKDRTHGEKYKKEY